MDSIVATIQPADCEQCKLAHMQADSQTSTDSEDLLQVDGASSEDTDDVTDDHPVQPKQAFFTVLQGGESDVEGALHHSQDPSLR